MFALWRRAGTAGLCRPLCRPVTSNNSSNNIISPLLSTVVHPAWTIRIGASPTPLPFCGGVFTQQQAGKKSFHPQAKKLKTHSGTKKRVRELDGVLVHWQSYAPPRTPLRPPLRADSRASASRGRHVCSNARHYNSAKRNARLKRLRQVVNVGPEMMRHVKRSFPYGVPASSKMSSTDETATALW